MFIIPRHVGRKRFFLKPVNLEQWGKTCQPNQFVFIHLQNLSTKPPNHLVFICQPNHLTTLYLYTSDTFDCQTFHTPPVFSFDTYDYQTFHTPPVFSTFFIFLSIFQSCNNFKHECLVGQGVFQA
jgi:hypothetical protein